MTTQIQFLKEFHIAKFKLKGLIYLQNCLFMLQIEQNKKLADTISNQKITSFSD